MAIAVGGSPTRTIAPVYKVRAADFITHDAADDGTDRSRDDGSDARADANTFDFASLGGKRRSKQRSHDESNEPGGAHGSSIFNENDQTTHGCATMFPSPDEADFRHRTTVARTPFWGRTRH